MRYVVKILLILAGAYILVESMRKQQNPLQTIIDSLSDVAQFTARGLRNNNPGNIRIGTSPWLGKVSTNTDGAFEQFDTPEHGIRALDKLLTNYRAQGFNTIEQIITRFAPGTENDTGAYIASVEQSTGVSRSARYPDGVSARVKLVRAIIKHENGFDPYTDALMARAIV